MPAIDMRALWPHNKACEKTDGARHLQLDPPAPGTSLMAASDIDFTFVRSVVDRAQSCLRPIKDAEILPAEAYVSEQFWEFEKRAIFAREWLCIGHVNEIPNAGDHLPLTIIDEPALVVRDTDGAVRVFSAI